MDTWPLGGTYEQLDPQLDYQIASHELDALKRTPVRELPVWVDERFLNHEPFAFHARNFKAFRTLFANRLKIEHHNIWCTGSGALGFSLNPNKLDPVTGFPKPFDMTSDLDIAIVSTHHFDQAWRELREAHHNPTGEPDRFLEEKLRLQRKTLFDGAIRTDQLLGNLSIAEEWRDGSQYITEWAAKEFDWNVEVKYWIYRDIWSVRTYVHRGVKKLKGSLE